MLSFLAANNWATSKRLPTGASIKDYEENPSWLGLGAGYAIFLGENVSIEPGLRYNLTMNEDFSDENIFQFNIGFALHF